VDADWTVTTLMVNVQSASTVYISCFVTCGMYLNCYTCLKKIPRDRNFAVLYDDEVCAIQDCIFVCLFCFVFITLEEFTTMVANKGWQEPI